LFRLQIEEKNKNINIQSNKKSCESSKNLGINIKKRKKNIRKLNYNFDDNRILNRTIHAKLRKNNSFLHEINLEFNTLKKMLKY